MKKKILITVGYKKRELEYICLLASVLEKSGFKVKVAFANFEVYFTIFSWKPDIILLGQVNQNENIAVAKYAKDSGVVVAVLNCEGSYDTKNAKTFFGINVDNFVDIYFSWAQQQYDDALKLSDIDASKLMITGTPKFDVYHSKLLKYYKQHAPYYGIADRKKPTICIASSSVGADLNWAPVKHNIAYAHVGENAYMKMVETQKEIRRQYIELVTRLADLKKYNVILRAHPLEDDREYRKTLSKYSNVLIDNTISPVALFTTIDVLIHRTSTLAIEAWAANVPTLSFDPVKNEDNWMLEFTQFETVLTTVDDVIKNIKAKKVFQKKVISDKKKVYLKQHYGIDISSKRLSSQKIATILMQQQRKIWRVVLHPFLVIYVLLSLVAYLFRKKYLYQVIALTKSNEYLKAMEELFITEEEVRQKTDFYTKML